jgi:hypothetical protein
LQTGILLTSSYPQESRVRSSGNLQEGYLGQGMSKGCLQVFKASPVIVLDERIGQIPPRGVLKSYSYRA